MKKWLLLSLTIGIFIALYFKSSFPIGQPQLGYSTIPDTDGDLLVSLQVARGARLYEDFSILYPPGRFFLQALLLKVSDFSFPYIGVFHIAANLLFFPITVFILTFWMLQSIKKINITDKKYSFYFDLLAFILSLLAPLLYLAMVHSGQEVHSLIAVFILFFLLPFKNLKIRLGLLGVMYGLIVLFRTDAGVIVTGAVVVTYLVQKKIVKLLLRRTVMHSLVGVLLVWLPTTLYLIFHGSIINFLYDTIILGLVVQPRFMSLPLPTNDVWLIFMASLIFIFTVSSSIFNEAKQVTAKPKQVPLEQIGLQCFALISVFSYIAALGRSDEPHLWYGLIWISPLFSYAIYKFFIFIFSVFKNKKLLFYQNYHFFLQYLTQVTVILLISIIFSYLMLVIKLPLLFLVVTSLLVFFIYRFSVSSHALLIGGSIASLIVFHSLSYIKIKWYWPVPPLSKNSVSSWVIADKSEFYGLEIVPETKIFLEAIRKEIPQTEKYLFTFPKNVLLTEQLGCTNPTRYIILMNERTAHTENEIISDLERTHTNYFLIFTKDAEQRGDLVWNWITKNTSPVKIFEIEKNVVELRKRN